MITAWENKWPTLPHLDFTTVSCHDIDTLCNIWEAVYRWTEVAWVGALIQSFFWTWNKMKLIKKCEVRFTVQDINSTHCSFVQEVRSFTFWEQFTQNHYYLSSVPWTLRQSCASPKTCSASADEKSFFSGPAGYFQYAIKPSRVSVRSAVQRPPQEARYVSTAASASSVAMMSQWNLGHVNTHPGSAVITESRCLLIKEHWDCVQIILWFKLEKKKSIFINFLSDTHNTLR